MVFSNGLKAPPTTVCLWIAFTEYLHAFTWQDLDICAISRVKEGWTTAALAVHTLRKQDLLPCRVVATPKGVHWETAEGLPFYFSRPFRCQSKRAIKPPIPSAATSPIEGILVGTKD